MNMKKTTVFILFLSFLTIQLAVAQTDTLKQINKPKYKIGIEVLGNLYSLQRFTVDKNTSKEYFTKNSINFGYRFFDNFWMNAAVGYWNNKIIYGKDTTNHLSFTNKGLIGKIGLEYIHSDPREYIQLGFYARQGFSHNNVNSSIIIKSDYYGDYYETSLDKFYYTWTEVGINIYGFFGQFQNISININPELAVQNYSLQKDYRLKQIVGWGRTITMANGNELPFRPRFRFEVGYWF